MAISAAEDLWGCFAFHPYLKHRQDHPDYLSYSFGKLDDFITNHETAYRRGMFFYDALSQDYFRTERGYCFLCPEVHFCRVCPVNAAYSASTIGEISSWVCKIKGIQIKERKRFKQEIERVGAIPSARIVRENYIRP